MTTDETQRFEQAKEAGHPTTREHYEKYRAMGPKLHIKVDKDSLNLFDVDLPTLQLHYLWDRHLNRIPLHHFDGLACAYLTFNRHHLPFPVSISELVCTYKHQLIYDVLGLEPSFTD